MSDSIGSTEFLRLIAEKNLHVVLERGTPRGKLKRDLALLKTADGKDVGWSGSFSTNHLELPIATLNDFLEASLLREAETDADGVNKRPQNPVIARRAGAFSLQTLTPGALRRTIMPKGPTVATDPVRLHHREIAHCSQ